MIEWLRSGWDETPDEVIKSASPVPHYEISNFQHTLLVRDTSRNCEDYHIYHIRMLAESMCRDGWVGCPLIVFDDGCLPDGNHRVRAAKLAGITIPVRAAVDREVYYEFYDWGA